MGDLVAFRRFIMSLRPERERLGLSLADVAKRAGIDKGALSRLENGQRLNPTVNTLSRYARALGKGLAWGLSEEENPRTSAGPPGPKQVAGAGGRKLTEGMAKILGRKPGAGDAP